MLVKKKRAPTLINFFTTSIPSRLYATIESNNLFKLEMNYSRINEINACITSKGPSWIEDYEREIYKIKAHDKRKCELQNIINEKISKYWFIDFIYIIKNMF